MATIQSLNGYKICDADARTQIEQAMTQISELSSADESMMTQIGDLEEAWDSISHALDGKAASSHNHAASDITSGTLAVARGGTGVTTEAAIGLKAYPVGAVYISYVSTSPASLFGGTWTAITGRFPYFNAGTGTGGSNTHTLTVAQIPSHSHTGNGGSNYNVEVSGGFNSGSYIMDTATNGTFTYNSAVSVGGGGSHNNMPAYQTLYAWRRTA